MGIFVLRTIWGSLKLAYQSSASSADELLRDNLTHNSGPISSTDSGCCIFYRQDCKVVHVVPRASAYPTGPNHFDTDIEAVA